jgi:hypothetical protein
MRASCPSSGITIEIDFDADEDVSPRPKSKREKWPIMLCALVAIVASSSAFLESPYSQRPAVRPYADAVRTAVRTAVHDAREGVMSRIERISRAR